MGWQSGIRSGVRLVGHHPGEPRRGEHVALLHLPLADAGHGVGLHPEPGGGHGHALGLAPCLPRPPSSWLPAARRAWSRSSAMSSGSSRPTETRMRFSPMPAAARSSGVSRRALALAACITSVVTSPSDGAGRQSFTRLEEAEATRRGRRRRSRRPPCRRSRPAAAPAPSRGPDGRGGPGRGPGRRAASRAAAGPRGARASQWAVIRTGRVRSPRSVSHASKGPSSAPSSTRAPRSGAMRACVPETMPPVASRVAVDPLGGGLQRVVRALRERPLQRRRGEGAVHHEAPRRPRALRGRGPAGPARASSGLVMLSASTSFGRRATMRSAAAGSLSFSGMQLHPLLLARVA